MKKTSTFKRMVSGIERYFFRRPNANVLMVARIKGAISIDQLNLVLSKIRTRHPLLGARILLDEQGIAWFTSKEVPELSAQVLPRATKSEWIQKVVEETSHYFPLDRGPLIRFSLLTSAESSELIITCHHTICDGLSLAYLIRDIMLNLGDPARVVEPLPVPPRIGKGNLPPSVSVGFLPRIGINIFNSLWKRKEISFDEQDYKTLHEKFWKTHNKCSILAWALNETQTSAIVAYCRENKISVHSGLCTAFLAAQSDVQGNSPPYLHNLSMTVNIRNRLNPPVGEDFGLYFSSFKNQLKYDQRQSFWSNALTFHNHIKNQLTDKRIFAVQRQLDSLHPSLLDSLYFSKYGLLDDSLAAFFLRMEGDDRINTGLDIANLGRLDFPREYGSLRLEELYGPSQHSDFQEKYLGILTFRGKMFLTFTFDEAVIGRNTIEEIKETATDYLAEATGW